jgi:hypothetical protein
MIAFGYTLSVSIQRARLGEHGHASHLMPVKRMKWFPTFLMFSYLSRILWLVLSNMHIFEWVHHNDDDEKSDEKYEHMMINVFFFLPSSTKIDLYVLGVTFFGKIATLFFFSSFSLLLLFLQDILCITTKNSKQQQQKTANISSQRFLPTAAVVTEYTTTRVDQQLIKSRTIFVVVNVWIYLAEFGLLLYKALFFSNTTEKNLLFFQMDYVVVAIFFLFLSIFIGKCAWKLRTLLLQIEFSTIATKIAWKITWMGFLIAFLLFFGKSVVFFLSLLNYKNSQQEEIFDPYKTTPWFFYTIPEILPGICVISMMSVKKSPTTSSSMGRMDEGSETQDSEKTPLLLPLRHVKSMGGAKNYQSHQHQQQQQQDMMEDLPPYADQQMYI